MTTTFANLAFSLVKRTHGGPSQQQLIDSMLSNPDTRKMIEQAMKNKKNKVIFSEGIQGKYQILHKRSEIKIVDENSKK